MDMCDEDGAQLNVELQYCIDCGGVSFVVNIIPTDLVIARLPNTY